jgi:peptide deformylase
MILPITAYGHPVLKKKGERIDKGYPDLSKLIADMFETMYNSNGVGLAAQQINRSIRLFVIDATPYEEEYPEAKDFKKVFINAEIVNADGEEIEMEEGCLSVPEIREYVKRPEVVYLSYYDDEFNFHEAEKFEGLVARIIQHEFDHTDGVLFVEKLPQIKKVLLKRKLNDISNGKVDPGYKMIYPKKKGKR